MRTSKTFLSLALIALLAAAVAAPTAQAAPPKRIVALTPFAANTLGGLGVTPVAIGETLGGKERFASNVRNVKRLTLSHPNGPNMEELALLNPQLVFSSTTWAKGTATMRDLGIKVVNADPANINQAYAVTRQIGKVVGKVAGAEALVAKMRKRIAGATKGIRTRPRTLVVLGVGRTPFVLLPNSWGGNIVSRAGAKLVTGGVARNRSGFVRISDERILTANPEVIIAIPHGNAEDMKAITKFLSDNPAWEGTDAVKNDRLYVSTDNALLQAGTDIADVIRRVRRDYLKNY